jgi:hypothetical protein
MALFSGSLLEEPPNKESLARCRDDAENYALRFSLPRANPWLPDLVLH